MEKRSSQHPKIFDMALLGTSPLVLIEASYHASNGKTVLVLEAEHELGGAWRSLEIFGLTNVENAVHYFMPYKNARTFMEVHLGLLISEGDRKYRILRRKNNKVIMFRYDMLFSKVWQCILEFVYVEATLLNLKKIIWSFLNCEWRSRSFYIKGGAPEILNQVKKLMSKTNLFIRLNTRIDTIIIEQNPNLVKLLSKEESFYARKLCISHGSRISKLVFRGHDYRPVEKVFLRPALHLWVEDACPSNVTELIFIADDVIKYAHDISDKALPEHVKQGMKLLVLALQPTAKCSPDLIEAILEKLRASGIIGQNAVLKEKLWQDTYLPRLVDQDLNDLRSMFPDHIDVLKTESFSACIGQNSKRWATVLPLIPLNS
jgi:hypothetical protein